MCKNYNSSNRSLVATIAILAICLVIVTGSTFSLFTSNTGVNIAVTAGNVEFEATINNALILYSMDKLQEGTFENGGTAVLNDDKNGLTITNITPGDKVELTIDLVNSSNVKTAYRVLWSYGENTLTDLEVSIKNGENYAELTSGTSQWYYLDANATVASTTLVIELPVDSEQETKVANISFAVEAVQANGTGLWKSDAYVNDAEGLQAAVNSGATKITLNESIEINDTIVIDATTGATTYSLRSFNGVVIDLNGKTITAGANITDTEKCALILNNGNVKITNGTINVENATAIRNNGASANLILENMTITQTGSDVPSEWLATAVFICNGATTVIENGTYTGVSSAAIVATSGGNLTINGGTFNAENTTTRVDSWSYNSILTINDGIFNSANKALYADGYKYVTINGGTFNATIDSTYSNIDIKGGTFNVSIKQPGGHQNKYAISGGSFVEDVSKYIAGDDVVVYENANGTYDVIKGVSYDAATKTYSISTAEGLVWLAKTVNKHSNYEYPFQGEIVVLTCDIDLGGMEWTPIGDYRFSANRFCGTFDGQNHTISNFKITKKTDKNDSNKSSYGFFGNLEGTVKNLTIDNASVSSYAYVGALVGRLNGGSVINCHVTNSTVACSYWQAGGMIGQLNGNCVVSGSSIINTTVTGKSAIGGLIGPTTLDEEGATLVVENCLVKDCQVIQKGSFGGNYDNFFGTYFGYLESDDYAVIINNCVAENTTVKGVLNGTYGDLDGTNITIDGNKLITSAEDFINAVKNGGTVILGADIAMPTTITPGKSFVIEGNGYTITMAEGCVNTYSLFDSIPEGVTAVFNNITFDGIKGGAILRSIGAEVVMNNVTVQNCDHTQIQGLIRILGKVTLTGCTFKNNNASMIVSINYDTNSNDQLQVVENCVFENNTCKDTAILYYVHGAGCTVNGNKFINNNVTSTANGATVYMGFTENNVITNNVFSGNTVVSTGTSKRVSGGIMIGYEAVITGNAFVNNSVSNSAGTALGNDVCASVYYTDIDLSGNYWGGNAPVQNENYFVEYTNYSVIINDYLTSIEE